MVHFRSIQKKLINKSVMLSYFNFFNSPLLKEQILWHTSSSLHIFSFIPHNSSTDNPYYQPHWITSPSSNSSCNVIALILCIECFLYLEYQSLHSLSENADSLFKISEWKGEKKREREKEVEESKGKRKERKCLCSLCSIWFSSGLVVSGLDFPSLFNKYLLKTNQVTKFALSFSLESGLALWLSLMNRI